MRIGGVWVVCKGLIKFDQLINGFIAHQGFTNKEHKVGLVDFDQLYWK